MHAHTHARMDACMHAHIDADKAHTESSSKSHLMASLVGNIQFHKVKSNLRKVHKVPLPFSSVQAAALPKKGAVALTAPKAVKHELESCERHKPRTF